MLKKKKQGHEFWVGRFSVEMAIALTWLEMGNPDLAKDGLKETMDEFLATEDADPELIAYLDDMRREHRQLTPVKVPYRGDKGVTGQEIASRL